MEDTYYSTLYMLINGDDGDPGDPYATPPIPPTPAFEGLVAWKNRIDEIITPLPDCIPNPSYPGIIMNSPCKTSADSDSDDEFSLVKGEIDTIINTLQNFMSELSFNEGQIQSTYTDALNQLNIASASEAIPGLNPIIYVWYDSRGEHTVEVTVSEFKIPSIKYSAKRGFWGDLSYKRTWKLKNYIGDKTNTYVEIRRIDPPDKPLGIIGTWKSSGEMYRKSCAEFSYNYVNLVPCGD
jgi:hypothetical protein